MRALRNDPSDEPERRLLVLLPERIVLQDRLDQLGVLDPRRTEDPRPADIVHVHDRGGEPHARLDPRGDGIRILRPEDDAI